MQLLSNMAYLKSKGITEYRLKGSLFTFKRKEKQDGNGRLFESSHEGGTRRRGH